MKRLDITFDQSDIDAIASDFDLRAPNKKALRALVMALTDDDFDPRVPQVLNLATGVGKTYLMAAFVEYLRRQGIEHVMIVTPSLTVQTKTVQNFTPGSGRYIAGAPVAPMVTTPQDYSAWRTRQSGPASLAFGPENPVMAFIFNIQQLIAPKSLDGETKGSKTTAAQLRTRKFDESSGALFEYLATREDLVVIADESHLYGPSAKAFSAALRELNPAATIGLTASASTSDHVVFRYPLYQAIADRFVKAPVLAFRKGGYGSDTASEEQQLRDALALRRIKQEAYDAWGAAHPGIRSLNAVTFVVCADVEHATQVSDLLRSPGYLDSDSAVLQVDNEHNDAATQTLLDRLDQPDSPVLAVVSVNKLKEGWDVKNIAVVVTLRAMASDVLTQQTMGRGLRLPFGAWTGVRQIDQLDIIAHQSFRELLDAEHVLQQFGLDEAVPQRDGDAQLKRLLRDEEAAAGAPDEVAQQHGKAVGDAHTTEEDAAQSGAQDVLVAAAGDGAPWSTSGEGAGSSEGPGLSVRSLDGRDGLLTRGPASTPEPVRVEMNPEFAGTTFTFPVTVMRAEQPKFTFDRIKPAQIQAAAAKVSTTGDVMVRKEIVASVGRKLGVADTDVATVESAPQSLEDAERTLTQLLMRMQVVPQTPQNIQLAKRYIIPTFLDAAPVSEWTVKAIASAANEMENLVKSAVADVLKETKVVTEIEPKVLPQAGEYYLPIGERVHEQIEDKRQFVKGRHYDGWFRGLFPVESFDSWSAEYCLARLLNVSPSIVWWKRLHVPERASIQYNLKNKYYPDFVALDTDGVHWIIEGKDARGRADDVVQAKREAAETTVIKLLAEPDFAEQRWGYLIAYEDDVAAAETWEELKGRSQPVNPMAL